MIYGDKVTYHGSVTQAHGPAFYLGWCACQSCKDLYNTQEIILHELETDDGQELRHVRRQSFTEKS